MSFQENSTVTSEVWPALELVNNFIGNIVWPLTLLVLIWMFRHHLKDLLGKLTSIDASSTGISLNFDKEVDEAIETLLPMNNSPEIRTKSGVSIGKKEVEKKPGTPFHQIMDLREKLSHRIILKAQENDILTEGKSSIELNNELLKKGSISFKDSKYFQVLVDLTNASDSNVTQSQVNKVKMLYNNLKI